MSDKEDVDDGQHVVTISDVESVEDVQTFKTVSDEEDVDDGENVNQPTEDQYSPEFLLCAAGNLEHVAKQVVNLGTRLRQAPFLDVDACLSEIISSCKSIVDSVQHVQKIAEKYTLQRSNDNGSLDQIHIFEDPSTQRDPGKRPMILSDANKRYLINLGPCQPKLDTFPKNSNIRKSVQNRFSSSWYREYPFLEYSISNDSAHCFVCSLFPSGIDRPKAEDAWIKGTRSWSKMKGSQGKGKQGKLNKHFSSKSHKSLLQDFVNFCQGDRHIEVLWDKEVRSQLVDDEKLLQDQREVISILLDISRTLARQGLAFRGNENEDDGNFCQIVGLMSRHVSSLKGWIDSRAKRKYKTTYMGPESQNEFIKMLADECREMIDAEIGKAPFTAVIADTTPDVSNDDQMAFAVRFVNEEGKPCERLLETKKVIDKTGAGLAKAILQAAQERNVDTTTIRYQTYDSASSMSGKYKGAQQILSELLERHIIYTACLPHGSNLVIEHASDASPIISNMYDNIEALYVFFAASTKRTFNLNEVMKSSSNCLKLTNLSKTRWSARPDAIKAVWVDYDEICRSLQEISQDRKFDQESRTKAFGLLSKIKSFDFIFALMFMKNIMFKMKMMIDLLQTEELDVSGALLAMQETKDSLQRIRRTENAIDDEVQAACLFARQFNVDAEAEFQRIHRTRVPPRRLDPNPETQTNMSMATFYRKEVFLFLDTMVEVLSAKINGLEDSFRPFIDVLDPNLIPTIDKVVKLANQFPSDIPDPEAFLAELEIFNGYYNKVKVERCETKLTIRDAAELAMKCNREKMLFPQVAKIYCLFLTSPPSVCKSERTFSRLKLLKNYLRSTMTQERLDNLMILFCERDIADKLSIEKVVNKWTTIRRRRIMLS